MCYLGFSTLKNVLPVNVTDFLAAKTAQNHLPTYFSQTNSWLFEPISEGFVVLIRCTKPSEMSSNSQLFVWEKWLWRWFFGRADLNVLDDIYVDFFFLGRKHIIFLTFGEKNHIYPWKQKNRSEPPKNVSNMQKKYF